MLLFKKSFKHPRANSTEIFKGFGFNHLDNVTHIFLHPKNESPNQITSLSQPIGEAVILFTTLYKQVKENKQNIKIEGNKRGNIYLEFTIPDEYKLAQVIDYDINRYSVYLDRNKLYAFAWDINNLSFHSDGSLFNQYYYSLPIFIALLFREIVVNKAFKELIEEFCGNPKDSSFVRICEDFYQNHKYDDYEISINENFLKDPDLIPFLKLFNEIETKKDSPLNIETFKDSEFSKEQLLLIPELPEEIKLNPDLYPLCNAVKRGDIKALLFHGPAGTGKTMNCKLICQMTKLPLMDTVNCTENLDEFVLGKFIPEEDKIVFKESYVTKAIRDGGAVVFEEINFARPQYLAFLNSLLDENGFVRLDNGEIVHRHPNFRFFATMNLGYYGTKELNQALFNRFNAVVEIDSLPLDAISELLLTRIPSCVDHLKQVLSVYKRIKRLIQREELDIVISPRNLENWVRLAQYEGYIKAAEKTIIPIAKADRDLEEALRNTINFYKWDNNG